MAEPLKDMLGPAAIVRIAAAVRQVWPRFPHDAFVTDATDGLAPLALLARGDHLADALRRHLPTDTREALAVVRAAAGAPLRPPGDPTLSAFAVLPFTALVARHGLGHVDDSVAAMHTLTQHFTAEWCIRPFLDAHPARMLDVLDRWVDDDSEHVRRLVSEGTRPRLPWGARLRTFGADPRVMLPRLARLRDDPSDYVRRSVANHLNDVGRADVDLLLDVAADWSVDAPEPRVALLKHALRSLVKAGHPDALAHLGAGQVAVALVDPQVSHRHAQRGDTVTASWSVRSTSDAAQRVVVDVVVGYAKARGARTPKVFKGRVLDLAAGATVSMSHRVVLVDLSTRRHHPGEHTVDVRINGVDHPVGAFVVA